MSTLKSGKKMSDKKINKMLKTNTDCKQNSVTKKDVEMPKNADNTKKVLAPEATNAIGMEHCNKMSEIYQKESKKLLKLAKKHESLNSFDKACQYYSQSLQVLTMAINYEVAFQESGVRDEFRKDVKSVQTLLSELDMSEAMFGQKKEMKSPPQYTEKFLLDALEQFKKDNPNYCELLKNGKTTDNIRIRRISQNTVVLSTGI